VSEESPQVSEENWESHHRYWKTIGRITTGIGTRVLEEEAIKKVGRR
jgi:hypothetical protein